MSAPKGTQARCGGGASSCCATDATDAYYEDTTTVYGAYPGYGYGYWSASYYDGYATSETYDTWDYYPWGYDFYHATPTTWTYDYYYGGSTDWTYDYYESRS